MVTMTKEENRERWIKAISFFMEEVPEDEHENGQKGCYRSGSGQFLLFHLREMKLPPPSAIRWTEVITEGESGITNDFMILRVMIEEYGDDERRGSRRGDFRPEQGRQEKREPFRNIRTYCVPWEDILAISVQERV